MKAFGVRLAAGALTILFGAYAAALAQKDKQEDPNNWTAKAPSLGQPAAPIADIGDETWISEPESDLSDPVPTNPVQLVQHTESAEVASVGEANVAEPSFSEPPQEALGFASVPDEIPVQTEATPSGPALTIPDTAESDWTTSIPADAGEPMTTGNEPMTLPGEQAAQLPELQIETGPKVEMFSGQPGELPAQFPVDGPATAELGMPQPEHPIQQDNMLRDDSVQGNVLRAAPATVAPLTATPNGELPPMETWAAENPPRANIENAPPTFAGAQQSIQTEPIAPQEPIATQADSNQLYQRNANFATATNELAPFRGEPNNRPVDYQQPAGGNQGYGGQPPTARVAINPDLAIDAPGDRRLEGAQTPSVVIQKRAPSEVKVGQVSTFAIHVQNVGAVEALDVRVHDKVPSGMELVDASPRPTMQGNNLLWQLGAMPAGDEQTITMQLVPRQEGELGSVARVSFEAAASVRTIATRPELKIVQRAPETVLIGQQLEIELEISNPGTGEATNVVVQEDVPQGLEHPKGRQLDNAIGNLAPGEIRRQVLRMRAVAPGIVQNTIRLAADDGLTSEHSVNVQIVAPELRVDLEGPSRRFLERQATYFVHLGNVGTADAHNVELSVQLDRGFTFVSTENQGQYDPSRHSVHWSLAQMPAGGNGKVALTLLPVQEGEQAITMDARADLGVVAKNERLLSVEGFAELSFSITNPGGPIELGAETTYEITVNNSGSKSDSNVQVQLQLPPGLELISAQGDAGTDGRGLVAFQPKATLAPGGEHTYKVRVRGIAPGTHIVKAVVVSNLATTPVTKEESTMVYADQ